MKRILCTGAAGFIGSNLVKELIKDKNNKIVVFDNFSTGARENLPKGIDTLNIHVVEGDLRNIETVRKVFDEFQPEIVFHLAAMASVPESVKRPKEFWDNNVQGLNNLLYCLDTKVTTRLIFASSSSVYGDRAKEKVKEEDAINAKQLSPYALTKMTCEKLIEMWNRLYNLNYVILRYFNVYDGLGKGRGVIDTWYKLKTWKMPIYQYGDTIRDYTHVTNIVRANILAMNTININTAYNISGNLKMSLSDVAKYLKVEPIKKGAKLEDVQICTANIQKAIDELNYVPKTFEGLNLV